MPRAATNKNFKNSFPGEKGPTLIERIQKQMDKRRNMLQRKRVQHGVMEPQNEREQALWDQASEVGRYEGMGAALAILRSSSLKHELDCSNERLGIE